METGFAKPGDSKGIAAVQKAGWLATYPDPVIGLTREDIETKTFDSEEQLQKWELAIEEQNDNSKRIWVARQDKKIIGYSVATKEGATNELKAIYVLPEYHGQSIGKPLMELALEWLGDKDVSVWVFTHNKRAIGFYRKHGFVESGKTSTWAINGKEIPDLEMIRKAR